MKKGFMLLLSAIFLILALFSVNGLEEKEGWISSAPAIAIASYSGQPYNCNTFKTGYTSINQSFTVEQIGFYLKRASGSVGTFKISLWNLNATGLPKEILSESSYTDGVEYTLTTNLVWYNFTISPVTINTTQEYMVCVWNNQPSNYIHLYLNVSNAYSGGGYLYYDTAWKTNYYATRDMSFMVYGSTDCSQSLVNTTATDWQNYTTCFLENYVSQNRSYVRYDENDCGTYENTTFWEYQNVSCDYSSSAISNIDKRVQEVENMLNMLPLVILYAVFLLGGIWLLLNKNQFYGIGLIALTIGFDFLLIREFVTDYILDSVTRTGWQLTFTGIFAISIVFWIIVKISMPIFIKYTKKIPN